MRVLFAKVQNGHLVLNEPTDLPEGKVVELYPHDEAFEDDDGMDEEERAELLRELELSIAEAQAGDTVDAREALAQLRAMK